MPRSVSSEATMAAATACEAAAALLPRLLTLLLLLPLDELLGLEVALALLMLMLLLPACSLLPGESLCSLGTWARGLLLLPRDFPGAAETELLPPEERGLAGEGEGAGAEEGGATRGEFQRGQGREGRERYWKTACVGGGALLPELGVAGQEGQRAPRLRRAACAGSRESGQSVSAAPWCGGREGPQEPREGSATPEGRAESMARGEGGHREALEREEKGVREAEACPLCSLGSAGDEHMVAASILRKGD